MLYPQDMSGGKKIIFNFKNLNRIKQPMKKILITLSIAFVAVTILSFTLSRQDGKWVDLFDGKSLKGWTKKGGIAEYEVKDGTIVGITKLGTPNTFLCTEKMYGDFILELDLMVDPLLNSGVQIRSNENDNGRVYGYQVEVDPSKRAFSGGIYDEGRRGWLYPLAANEAGRNAFKVDGWNSYRIEAIGNTIRTWINGVQCSELIDDMTAKGFIALQVHGVGNDKEKEGINVKWKNIKILTEGLEDARWRPDPDIEVINLVPNHLSPKEKRKGWKLLWDGKTSSGWKSANKDEFPAKGWRMENGELTVMESGGGEAAHGGDIITREKYSSFELKVDFKITKGANSGIKYFVDPDINQGTGSSIGLEYQILDDKNHPDAGHGVLGNRTLASLYDLIPAKNLSIPWQGKPFRGVGKWNNAHIIVKGNNIEHWLNGIKVVEYERNTQMYRALVAYSKYKVWENFGEAKEGHILLQDHGNEVSFRSIKIREL